MANTRENADYGKHNLDLVRVMVFLGNLYVGLKSIPKHIDDLLFWFYAYKLIVTNGDTDRSFNCVREFAIKIGGTDHLNQKFIPNQLPRINERYFSGNPYVIGNDKFLKLFPEARRFSKEFFNHITAKDRAAAWRKEQREKKIKAGETKKQKIQKRREEVAVLREDKRFLVKEIAKALNVSISTIEKDLHALREAGRIISRQAKKVIKEKFNKLFQSEYIDIYSIKSYEPDYTDTGQPFFTL